MLKSIGMPELLVIFLTVVLLFGGKKVGELMKGAGNGIRDFKKALKEGDEAAHDASKL